MTVKGLMPAHIKPKTFHHPQPTLQLIRILEGIPDPRKPSCNFKYSLTSIVFIVMVTTLSGADDWQVMEDLANSMNSWIGQFVDISTGIPSAHTMERVFSLIAPDAMEATLIQVMNILKKKKETTICFDGKTMRGTVDTGMGKKAMHILNAWSTENGMCLGQKKVDDKTNEITAIPELMEMLDLKGTIITADALNTQKEVAQKAQDKGADYILPVKGNHKGLLEDIELLFKEAKEKGFKRIDADQYETIEKSHGRVEIRQCFSMDAEDLPDKIQWSGIKSIGMVIRERMIKEKRTKETTYYISSCEIDAKLLAGSVRDHWQIENNLHWSLDVVFREDKIRYRHRIGARNLSTIRKIVLGALSKDKSRKCGRAGKRIIAAGDPIFRSQILNNLF